MVSDVPYGMSYQSGWKDDSRVKGDGDTFARDEVLRRWGDRPAMVFGRWDVPRPVGTRFLLIWDKGDWPGMGDLALPWGPSTEEIYVIGSGWVGKRSGQIIRDPKRPPPNGDHPTQKPVGLMEVLIRACPPGIIVDPFMGSGTTLVAAKNIGRKAIGVELEEKYCEAAARRLSQEVLF
jgi:site-specific DNA-methyltransferase (adenine-specific)